MNYKEYILEEMLPKKIKLKFISTYLGELIISINSLFSNSDFIETDKKDVLEDMIISLKQTRKETLKMEKLFYEKSISYDRMSSYLKSYLVALKKTADIVSSSFNNRKSRRVLDKIEILSSEIKKAIILIKEGN